MRSLRERERFGERLREALLNANYSPESPTEVAREFNIRFPGRPVTAHAARKWLKGEAMPTAEKLNTLAQWLGVPHAWLRCADEKPKAPARSDTALSDLTRRLSPAHVKLIAHLKGLDEYHQVLAREMISILASFKSASDLQEMDEHHEHLAIELIGIFAS